MSDTKKRPAIENELQRIARSLESMDRSLKQFVIIKEKSLSGQVFTDFDSAAALKAKEKNK